MADMNDIEPNSWRAEREITSENTVRTIISSLLHLQSSWSTYVSIADMEEMIHAREAFDSRQMNIDELLLVIQEASQKAEERQATRNRSLENLRHTLSGILAKTESWPSPLRIGIRKRCKTEQRWLNSARDKAASGQTAGEITTRIKKETEDIEGRIKNLNDYFEFADKNAKLPEEPTDIPHFHIHWNTPADPDWISKIKPIIIYDTHDWVFSISFQRFLVTTPKCRELGCPSLGKPHSHVINNHNYDVVGWPYLFLCHNVNCEFWHAHPQLLDNKWIFDCIKHKKRPDFMPSEAKVFEQPITLA